MPSGSKSRGRRYSIRVSPVSRWTIAASVGARLVVGEHAARLPIRRDQQEAAYGFGWIERQCSLGSLLEMPASHRGHVTDQDRPTPPISDLTVEFGKVGEHSRVKVKQPFGDGERRGSRSEALAERVEQVRLLRQVRRPPTLGHDLAVPDDDQAVHLDVRRRFHFVEKG